MGFEQTILLLLNLFLISLGLSISMRKKRLMGVLPLTFFLGYNLANALGRTSGGRYIVPVDWIIILYFVIGLFQICLWIFGAVTEKKAFFSVTTFSDNISFLYPSYIHKTLFVY